MSVQRQVAYAAFAVVVALAVGCTPSCKAKSDCPSDQTCVPNLSTGVNMCCPAAFQCAASCCPPGFVDVDGGSGSTGLP